MKEEASCTRKAGLGCPLLDNYLGVALRSGHVIEVTGEAGSGKTQLLLNALSCSLKSSQDRGGKDCRGLVVSTEGAFPAERLQQMFASCDPQSNPLPVKDAMNKILVQSLTSLDDFFECLTVKIPRLAETFSLNILVVDSVAAPLRSEEFPSGRERTLWVHKIGQALHHLAATYDMPVIVSNQVTALIDQAVEMSYGHPVVPCFGLAFSTYVHTRIFVERTDQVIKMGQDKQMRLRTACIDFCPFLPSGNPHHFIVTPDGIRGVNISS